MAVDPFAVSLDICAQQNKQHYAPYCAAELELAYREGCPLAASRRMFRCSNAPPRCAYGQPTAPADLCALPSDARGCYEAYCPAECLLAAERCLAAAPAQRFACAAQDPCRRAAHVPGGTELGRLRQFVAAYCDAASQFAFERYLRASAPGAELRYCCAGRSSGLSPALWAALAGFLVLLLAVVAAALLRGRGRLRSAGVAPAQAQRAAARQYFV